MDQKSTAPNRLTRFFARSSRKAGELIATGNSIAKVGVPPVIFKRPIVRSTAKILIVAAGGGGWWRRSFLLLVAAPSLLFFLYMAFWQSSGYVAEARVTVRAAQEFKGSTSDASGIISRITSGGAAAKATIQDSYMVLNYIKSSALLIDFGGNSYFEKYYALQDIDYFSRLQTKAKIENLMKYWQGVMAASVDTVSGVLTIKVEAFRPEDASQIVRDVVRRSEIFVNGVSVRSRKDAVERAEQEVRLSFNKLGATRDRLTMFRDKNAIIDPGMRAKSIAELIAQLTLTKINIENSLATLKGSLTADSPTQRIQSLKLNAIDKQIADLKKNLTNSNSNNAVSSQIAAYERLKLDEQFDEMMYTIAQSAYQRARQEMERQQLYLAVVVPPSTPEIATYPKIAASSFFLFAALSMFWSIGALIIASINDQIV